MIHDYKFDGRLNDYPRKPRSRAGIYLSGLVLLGTLAALGLHDTEANLPPHTEAKKSLPLTVSMDSETEVIQAPLSIPGQTLSHPIASPVPPTEATLGESEGGAPSLLASAVPVVPVLAGAESDVHSELKELQASRPEPNSTGTVPESIQPLAGPPAEPAAASSTAETSDKGTGFRLKRHTIVAGDTLAGIFADNGLSPSTLHRLLQAGNEAKSLSRIRPGQELAMRISAEGQLDQLVLVRNRIESLRFDRKDEGFSVHVDNRKVERKTASVAGTIQSSLFVDGLESGLSDGQIMELAEVFGWDIDFALEIRAGDQFRVVFEEQYVDGEKHRNGPILAAEFVNRGRVYQAFRYENGNRAGYYDADGRSKRRAFIRTPIKFARISSRFQPKRWHPVLKKWKAHKGVDYAAPTGTSIKATGDGKVVFRGWQKGYGRIVIVQHSNQYKTVYAHMSKFRSKVKKGSRVKQGQVIGYVGSSGWATGPHLHYEFRVNNVKRNPLTVDLPKSLPLPRNQLAKFKQEIAPLTQQLASIRPATMVAHADN